MPIRFHRDAASGYRVSKRSPACVKTCSIPPSCVGSLSWMAVSFATNTSTFFAGLVGLPFRRSLLPAMGWPPPGGNEVVVTVVEVITVAVVVVAVVDVPAAPVVLVVAVVEVATAPVVVVVPGGNEVVVTVVEVVVAQTPLLAGVGVARAKSVLSLPLSAMRCRLMVPLPAASGDGASSAVCSVPV